MLCELFLLLAQTESGPEVEISATRVEFSGIEAFGLSDKPSSVLAALESEVTSLHEKLRPFLLQLRTEPIKTLEKGSVRSLTFRISGVVIDEGGLFVTPGVPIDIEDLRGKMSAHAYDGRKYAVEILDHDPVSGLFLMRAVGLKLGKPPLANTEALRIGSLTFSLGNPHDLEGSMHLGFLASKNRSISGIEGFLQVTNPVNPGEGGGLLANRKGEVIGLLYSSMEQILQHNKIDPTAETASYQGIGFAFPVSRVLKVFQGRLKRPPFERRALGIRADPLAVAERRLLGLPAHIGLKLNHVYPDTAASDAGLMSGDILYYANGIELSSHQCLKAALSDTADRMTVRVLRGGRQLEMVVQFETPHGPPPPGR